MPAWNNATTTPATRGVVRRGVDAAIYDHGTQPAAGPAAAYVEHLWWVRWDRCGLPPHRVQTVPSPALHLTVEGGDEGEVRHGHRLPATLVHGVPTRAFAVELTGSGWVVGARFRLGGWAAWSERDASALTDRVVAASDPLTDLHERVVGADLDERLGLLGAAIDELAPPPPDELHAITLVDERMRADPSLTRVDQLAARCGWSPRTLQRTFRRLVGVSPKWVLARYRLQEAALRLEEDPGIDIAALAASLGWYDQAHFSNHFRDVLGATPADYAARAARRASCGRPGDGLGRAPHRARSRP